MSDLISRQAAIDALDKEYRYGADIDRCGLSTALDEIEAIPAADVVSVVRCRDCKHLGTFRGKLYCRHNCGIVEPKENDFCSYGERKE